MYIRFTSKEKNVNKYQQGKGYIHKTQPRHNPAITAGHKEGIGPKPGENTGAPKGEGHFISEMIRTKTELIWNK
jgi:hypothetical protein